MKIELPITFIVENHTDKVAKAKLLGFNHNWIANNFGSDVGVTVAMDDPKLTHADVMQYLYGTTEKIIIDCNNSIQKYAIMEAKCEDASGKPFTIPLIPSPYIDGKSGLLTQIKLGRDVGIEFDVQPKTKLKVTFE